MINWSEVIYLGTPGSNAPATFTVNLYSQDGVLQNTQTVTLNPLEERDVQAGHEIIDPATGLVVESVYLVEVIPQDPNAEYLFSAARYSTRVADTFNYAMAIPGRPGLGGANKKIYAAASAETFTCGSTQNWIEVANVTNAVNTVLLTFRDDLGNITAQSSNALAPRSQFHFNASIMLGGAFTGSVEIETNQANSIIAQSMNYILDCNANGVQTAYVTLAREPGRRSQVGTGNSFLDMENLLRVVSTTNSLTNTNIGLETFVGETSGTSFPLLANGCHDLDVSNDPTIIFPANRYGILDTQTNNSSESIMDMLRKRSRTDAGVPKFDFIIPTLVR